MQHQVLHAQKDQSIPLLYTIGRRHMLSVQRRCEIAVFLGPSEGLPLSQSREINTLIYDHA